MNQSKVERALRDLDAEGFRTTELWLQLTKLVESRERGVPTEDDTAWPLLSPCGIEEHLKEKPFFGCNICQGRSYVLTQAQRQVLREWFNMIPSPEVEVIELSVYPGTAVAIAREVVLATTAHVVRGKVLNGPRKVTISRFGAFMSACCAREKELQQQAEIAKLTKRVEALLARAKDAGVVHEVRAAGTVAYPWHSQIETKKLTDAAEIREELRVVLLSKGEQELAKLVREPSAWDPTARSDAKADEFSAFLSALGLPTTQETITK